MIECVRRLQFCAGHRVFGHEGKCRYLHGHNYVVYLHARARPGHPSLDSVGRVIDFGVLKERIGKWIEEFWDHGFLFWNLDEQVWAIGDIVGKDRLVPLPCNPTAENLARYLLTDICPAQLGDSFVEVWKVRIEETENCSATATLEGLGDAMEAERRPASRKESPQRKEKAAVGQSSQ